jgi:hypothetical protein
MTIASSATRPIGTRAYIIGILCCGVSSAGMVLVAVLVGRDGPVAAGRKEPLITGTKEPVSAGMKEVMVAILVGLGVELAMTR